MVKISPKRLEMKLLSHMWSFVSWCYKKHVKKDTKGQARPGVGIGPKRAKNGSCDLSTLPGGFWSGKFE